MSTTTNEAVRELYCELVSRQKKQNEYFASMSLKKRAVRGLKNPMLFFSYVFRKIFGILKNFYNYHTNELYREYRRVIAKQKPYSMFNNFTPTDKVFPNIKIAVYTSIIGGYDDLREPIYIDDDIDYYNVTDSTVPVNGGSVWKPLPVPSHLDGLSNQKKQRYIKLHPDEFLALTGEKYDYSIYIDGRVRITCDIKPLVYSLIESGKSIAVHNHFLRDCAYEELYAIAYHKKLDYEEGRNQLKVYEQEGFPHHAGLFENTVIIRKCNDEELQSVMELWWQEIKKYTYRDQLSFNYVLWKSGKGNSYVFSLGNNVWDNPYFLHYRHNTK